MSAITISYNQLVQSPESLQGEIESAFGNGEDALGVIIIKGGSSISSPLFLSFFLALLLMTL
jgi:hypothetical protein